LLMHAHDDGAERQGPLSGPCVVWLRWQVLKKEARLLSYPRMRRPESVSSGRPNGESCAGNRFPPACHYLPRLMPVSLITASRRRTPLSIRSPNSSGDSGITSDPRTAKTLWI